MVDAVAEWCENARGVGVFYLSPWARGIGYMVRTNWFRRVWRWFGRLPRKQ